MPTPPLDRVAFILGAPRSGTTLLRVMLAGHPRLFSPPEMILAPFATMAERKASLEARFWEKGGLRRALMDLLGTDVGAAKAAEAALEDRTIPEVYAHLQSLLGGRMLVDKCPHLCALPGSLERVGEWFPDARYLWIVRHPGSVIRSLENMPMAEVMLQGYAEAAKEIWYSGNETVRQFLQGVPKDRWLHVSYEELVKEPAPLLERACATLGVEFHPAVLDPYEGDRMREGPKGARAIGDPNMAGRGRIQPELATSWLEGFDRRKVSAQTRGLAKDLGYDLDALPLPAIAKVTDAMDALWTAAREVEASIDLPMDLDALEGRRFLLRMVTASLDLLVEQADADRPAFFHSESATRKMFADCPDADYLRAPIKLGDGRVYRLSGHVPPGTLYVGILLYGKGGRVGNRLRDQDLPIDAHGNFEIRIASTEQPGTFLLGQGDENAVIVRQYFADRTRERPIEVSLELCGGPPAPGPLRATELCERIGRAERMLRTVFTRTVGAYKTISGMALNRFFEIPADQLFPTPDNRYLVSWYRFGQDQVMFVRGKLPTTRYFGFTLYNAWLESFDYTRHRIGLNHSQIRHAPDGSFEVCLAHRDPGHENWIDTAGHHAGYLVARHLLLEGEPPALEIEVIYEKEWAARKAQRGATAATTAPRTGPGAGGPAGPEGAARTGPESRS